MERVMNGDWQEIERDVEKGTKYGHLGRCDRMVD